ncbi:MAG TPA: PPOX class F420-dependent oxidoreductase [Ktedonobacteraceae bacterium]
MTISRSEVHIQQSDPFVALDKNQFARLTTYRKTGVGVPTPVWFAHADGTIYVVTPAKTGKLKRIRNNGRATLAACKANGQVIGENRECVARVLSEEEQAVANQTLARKYGLRYRIFTGFQKMRGVQSSFIAITI